MYKNFIKFSCFFILILMINGCSGSNSKQQLIDKAGAPLLSGLGDHSHLISSDQEGVQEYFNQGLVLAFAFNNAD